MARQQTVSGRRRARPDAERIVKRVAGLEAPLVRDAESGVVPLNPGFFAVEQLRTAAKAARTGSKARIKSR